MDGSRRIGAVIPCKNEAGNIERCLSSIRRQVPGVERVVVVDNDSTDDSRELAAAYAEVVSFSGRGIARVRNVGAGQLDDVDAIAFVDADCALAPGWVAAGLQGLDDGAAVVGSRCEAPAEGSWVERRWAALDSGRAREDSLIWANAMLVDMAAYRAVGGFDESLATNEDADLCLRIKAAGGRISNRDDMRVVHYGFSPDLAAFIRRERWHASTPGWFQVMSPISRGYVLACAAWAAAGVVSAGVATRSSGKPAAAWLGGTLASVPVLGFLAGRTARTAVQDGVLMWAWGLSRASRLRRATRRRRR